MTSKLRAFSTPLIFKLPRKYQLGRIINPAGTIGRTQVKIRTVNAEPWEPLPGMEKRQCPECRYLFAAPPDVEELRCPDCVAAGARWLVANSR